MFSNFSLFTRAFILPVYSIVVTIVVIDNVELFCEVFLTLTVHAKSVPFWTIVPGFMVISKIFQGFDHRKSSKSKQPYNDICHIFFATQQSTPNTTQHNTTQRNTDQSNLYSREQHDVCITQRIPSSTSLSSSSLFKSAFIRSEP